MQQLKKADDALVEAGVHPKEAPNLHQRAVADASRLAGNKV